MSNNFSNCKGINLEADASPVNPVNGDISYDGTNLRVYLAGAWVNIQTEVPVGTVFDYAGSSEPTGYLFCYGQAVSRSTYSRLFTALNTQYGVGDGSSTFNLPDLRGRVVAGKDDMGGVAASRVTNAVSGFDGTALGAAGGAQNHTLITGEIPSHLHTISHTHSSGTSGGPSPSTTASDGTHTHDVQVVTTAGGTNYAIERIAYGTQGTLVSDRAVASGSNHSHSLNSHAHSISTGAQVTTDSGNTGGAGAHRNMQPTLVLNKVIKY